MKFLAAIVCLLLSLAAFFFAVDASGASQDLSLFGQTIHVVHYHYILACVAFGLVSVALFVSAARRGL